MLTVRLTLRDLSQHDPLTAVGAHYDVQAVVAMKRIHLDAVTEASGMTFYAFSENLDEGTGEPETVQLPGTSTRIRGRIDMKRSTITLTAPLSAYAFRTPLQQGRTFTHWYAASYRMAGTFVSGGATVPADDVGTKRVHRLGERPCGTIPAA